jgi:hypothetical protein
VRPYANSRLWDFSGMIVVADTAPLNYLIQIDCEAIVYCNHGFTADLSTTLRSGRADKVSNAIVCHLDRSVAGFPATRHWTRPRVRLSVKSCTGVAGPQI